MNDPWPLLIAALSGQRMTIPSTWPARTVHRLENCVGVARAPRQGHGSLHTGAPLQLVR